MIIETEKIETMLNNDPEFKREIRYCNGTLKMLMGDDTLCMIFKDGKLITVTYDLPAETTADFVLEGTDDLWENILATYPVPWYPCIESSCAHHGMKMTTNIETYAYLAAWNRLIKVLRLIVNP
jgi:hypothetical protein